MDIFDKVCRSCNNERTNMLNVYQSKLLSNTTHIEEMLRSCTQTEVTIDDEYPKQICYICAKQLEITYKFLQQYSRSKTQFDNIINYVNQHHPDEESESLMSHEDEQYKPLMTLDPKEENKPITVDKLIEQDCNFKFDLDNFQEVEQSKVHRMPINTDSRSSVDSSAVEITKAESAERISCTQCSKTFFTAAAMIMHQKISHKRKAPVECTQRTLVKYGKCSTNNCNWEK